MQDIKPSWNERIKNTEQSEKEVWRSRKISEAALLKI